MSEVRIDTPRGVTLVGSFTLPEDTAPMHPSKTSKWLRNGDNHPETGRDARPGAANNVNEDRATARPGPASPGSPSTDGTGPSATGVHTPTTNPPSTHEPDSSKPGPSELSPFKLSQPRRPGVVLIAHDFLTDRHGAEGRLDLISASYRKVGLATLSIDFSGLGESDDDVITLANEAEDLRAVSSWLAERGYTRQAIHANGFGATAALLARPEQVRTAVLVGAVVGPRSVLWEQVFSPGQLDELSRHGLTRLLDDNPNSRKWNVLSKETLADFSMQEPRTIMAELPWPVLMIYGALANEIPDTATAAQTGFPLLKDGSRLVQVDKEQAEDTLAEVARLGTEWVAQRLR